jgi:hypothetical protein
MPRARAQRLVIDLGVRVLLRKFLKPLGVDHLGECSASPIDQNLGFGHGQQQGQGAPRAQPQTRLFHARFLSSGCHGFVTDALRSVEDLFQAQAPRILVVRGLSRQGVPQVQENQAVVRIPRRARSRIPRIAEEVRILEDEAQRAIVRVLPERLVETESAFLDSAVLAVGRSFG